jgi:signal transduction histidine kinase/CheY-like chemotaxis protein
MTSRMNLWGQLTQPADGAAQSYEEGSRLTVRNAIFLFGGVTAAIGVPVFAAVGWAEIFLASAGVSVGCLLGYLLSRAGHRRSAALCAILPLDASLVYNTQNFGQGLFECVYLMAIALAFLTLDRRDTWTIIGAVALTMGAAALGTFDWWPPLRELTRAEASGLRLATFALVTSNVSAGFMYFLAHRDRSIRKLHQVARAAEAASEAKTRFLANMSHELRTPLNGVLGVLDILDDTALGDVQREHVDSARTAGRSLLAIIDDILDLAKVESGMMVLAPGPFDLRDMVAALVRQTEIQVRDRPVAVVMHYPDHVPAQVIGDAKRVRQVLSNLLGNAAKFTPAGEIAVTVASVPGDGGVATFSLVVSDTGIGIPGHAQPTIFEKFQQVDDSAARRIGGTGLGLAIVKELVTRMYGSVHVDSEPGHGSRFHVLLPLRPVVATRPATAPATRPAAATDAPAPAATDAPALPAAIAGASDAAEPHQQPHVLVVEDNLLNQKVAMHGLRRLGCRVDVAGDGNEALARIEQTPYAMVFMDVQMPGMDGLETTRAIRARERESGGRLRIVAMTAHAFPDDRQRCIDAGMDDHVSKPVVPDVLAAVLHRYIAFP